MHKENKNQERLYIQHEGKVIETGGRFKHIMAIALNPKSAYADGIARCIVSREGDLGVKGYVDRSELYKIKKVSDDKFEITDVLQMANSEKIIDKYSQGLDFLGPEDPDIWIGEHGEIHVYFTLPFINKNEHGKNKIHLGHATGKDMDHLEMTEPALVADSVGSAKELSVAPANKNGVRLNLVESSKRESDFNYSVVRVAVAERMELPWRFGDIVFHPKEHNLPWIGGHASPGPLLPKEFIDLGGSKLLGIMNGREANRKAGEKTIYGVFSVGLFVYDYENGLIEWVSPEPLIIDSEAKIITFASQFVPTGKGKGILYAHIDDSFVRAYSLQSDWLRRKLDSAF